MTQQFKDILNTINPDILENPDIDLVEEGIIDSFAIMTIIGECEEVFDIDFDPSDILPENFCSPEKIWLLIEKYQSEQ